MTQSFFSALRLAVMLLTVDGKVTSAERDWFRRLQNSLPLSKAEKEILRDDLKATASLKQVTDLFYLVTDPDDRSRLLKLLRAAMAVDAESNHHSIQFYHHIVILNQSPPLEAEHFARESVVARSSLSLENQHWADFEKSAQAYTVRSKRSSGHPEKIGFLSTLYVYFPGSRFWIFTAFFLYIAFSILTECRYHPWTRRYRWRQYHSHSEGPASPAPTVKISP